MSELFTVNDCENAHNERQTKCFIGISNQMFYTRPSGHLQSSRFGQQIGRFY